MSEMIDESMKNTKITQVVKQMIWMLFPGALQQFGSYWKDTTHPEKPFAAQTTQTETLSSSILLLLIFHEGKSSKIMRLCSSTFTVWSGEKMAKRSNSLFSDETFSFRSRERVPLFLFFLRGAHFNLGHQTRHQEEWSWHEKVPGSLVAVHLWSHKTTRVGAKRRPYTIDYLTTCKPITKEIMTQDKRTYFRHRRNSRSGPKWTDTAGAIVC